MTCGKPIRIPKEKQSFVLNELESGGALDRLKSVARSVENIKLSVSQKDVDSNRHSSSKKTIDLVLGSYETILKDLAKILELLGNDKFDAANLQQKVESAIDGCSRLIESLGKLSSSPAEKTMAHHAAQDATTMKLLKYLLKFLQAGVFAYDGDYQRAFEAFSDLCKDNSISAIVKTHAKNVELASLNEILQEMPKLC